MEREHRFRGVANDGFCGAAGEQPRDAAPAVRTDHDQAAAVPRGCAYDHRRDVRAAQDVRRDAHAARRDRRRPVL